jgi:4'-phosphopantetheinyl transferase EntD
VPAAAADRRSDLIRGRFGPGTAVSGLDIASCDGALFPEEAHAVARAVPARVQEFTAGRVAARRAMAALGVAAQPVPMAPDRAPVWPAGIVGSLSHADGFAAAVVAQSATAASLGLDLEEEAGLEPLLWDAVLIAEERAFLAAQPEAARNRLARLIFSAKECAYKAQYPLTGALLEFSALQIGLELETCKFTAVFRQRTGCFEGGAVLNGRFAAGYGLIVTAMELV